MTSIALGRDDVIIGVDTHKDEHVAVAIDGLGGRLGELELPATNEGYAQLLAWAEGQGQIHGFGVEGCGSYGLGLARFLRRHGHAPVEVRVRLARVSGVYRARATPSTPNTPPDRSSLVAGR